MGNEQHDAAIITYIAVCNGYSIFSNEGIEYFVKHPNQRERMSYILKYNSYITETEALGVLKREDQIKEAADQGWWSKEKEIQIGRFQMTIERLIQTKKNLLYESDKKRIVEQINAQNVELNKLLDERSSYVRLTAEDCASRKVSDYFINNFIFKDPNCSQRLFQSQEEFDCSPDDLIEYLTSIYHSYLGETSENKIKQAAISHFLQNVIYIDDLNTNLMFGKSVIDASIHQIDLLFFGKYYNFVIKNSAVNIPDELYAEPDKLVEWVNSAGKRRDLIRPSNNDSGSGSGSTFLLGSREDIKEMGLEISGDKVLAESKEKGGLSFHDVLEK